MKKLLLVVMCIIITAGMAVADEKKTTKEKNQQTETPQERGNSEYIQILGLWKCGDYRGGVNIRFGMSAIELNNFDMMGKVDPNGEMIRYMGSTYDGDELVIRTTGRTLVITKISKYKIRVNGFSECDFKY